MMMTETPVCLVAVTGGSGSGKTWLADQLHRLLGRHTGRLSQDNFYRDWSHLPAAERHQVNFDHPDALDWARFADVLRTLRMGRDCLLPVYDFATHSRLPEAEYLPVRSVMIVDGLWLLHHPSIRRLFELSIFLHCGEEERLRRRIARDAAERGRTEASVVEQFHRTVEPMHREFVSPQAAHADLLMHHPCREMEILQLQERLSRFTPVSAGMGGQLMTLFRSFTPSMAGAAGVLS